MLITFWESAVSVTSFTLFCCLNNDFFHAITRFFQRNVQFLSKNSSENQISELFITYHSKTAIAKTGRTYIFLPAMDGTKAKFHRSLFPAVSVQ